MLMGLAALGLSGVLACSSERSSQGSTAAASVVLVNGRMWTGDPRRPQTEAIAISGEHITAVGTTAEIEAQAGAGEVIDLAGAFVTPGFIDSHVHFLDGGFRLSSVQLRDANTREEFVARIKAFAESVPPGTWITGGDWDHQLWGGELPRRDWIDAVTPNHPVWINRLDGHMSLANGAALAGAGVARDVKDVAGGEIVRDTRGDLTGLLKDNAMTLVESRVPPPSDAMKDRAFDAAMKYVNARGVTTIHNMGSWADLEVMTRAWKSGRLTTRMYAVVPLQTWERLRKTVEARTYGPAGRGDAWLRIGGLKGFVDGSLGSHTAAFHEPFTDAPNDRGLFVNTPEDPPDDDWRQDGVPGAFGALSNQAPKLPCVEYSRPGSRRGKNALPAGADGARLPSQPDTEHPTEHPAPSTEHLPGRYNRQRAIPSVERHGRTTADGGPPAARGAARRAGPRAGHRRGRSDACRLHPPAR
jgi:Amidohydrolase family